MNFEFAAPGRILFGEGRVGEVPALVAGMGTRALVVEGRSGRAESLVRRLREQGTYAATFRVASEPTVSLVEQGTAHGRAERCDVVVALGGGSVIDAGKAIAALLTNDAPIREYLEVIGNARPLANRPAPFIAIPTTAGTGAEVTRNAVLMAEEEQVKVSLRSALMLPAVAVIDPELTYSLPPAVTASTGLDALTQCIEPFVSCQHNPLTDALALEGVRRGARSLLRAFRHGAELAAREDMAVCSLFGGLALANAKLGAVHGFAAAVGGQLAAPHGAVCARLLPLVMQANVAALRARAPHSPLLRRYEEVARLLTGSAGASIQDGVAFVAELARDLAIPPLAGYGVTTSHIPSLVAKAAVASSTKGNPIVLSTAELTQVMEWAL